MKYKNTKEWYLAARARPQSVTNKIVDDRLKAAKIFHESSIKAGLAPTDEMIADEMLLITGRMNREEFNAYLDYKESKGGYK